VVCGKPLKEQHISKFHGLQQPLGWQAQDLPAWAGIRAPGFCIESLNSAKIVVANGNADSL
jgi:hypothetical protein